MAEFDQGVKIIADTTGRQLARLAGVPCQQWAPLESTLPTTLEWLADRVFVARQRRKRFVVYFEFYTRWDPNAPWDMLAKSGLLSRREHLPTLCIAIIFRRRGFRTRRGRFRLEAAGGPTQQLWFREVCLWQTVPEPWWETVPGLMALYPLCRHGRSPRDAIRHAAEVIERTVTAPGERADALALLTIFGELAYPRLDIERIIGSEAMHESRFLRRAREEGYLEARRAGILQALEIRLGTSAATEFAAAVRAIDDLEILSRLFGLAVGSATAEEFRAALQAETAER
jgi:hypothetical protein